MATGRTNLNSTRLCVVSSGTAKMTSWVTRGWHAAWQGASAAGASAAGTSTSGASAAGASSASATATTTPTLRLRSTWLALVSVVQIYFDYTRSGIHCFYVLYTFIFLWSFMTTTVKARPQKQSDNPSVWHLLPTATWSDCVNPLVHPHLPNPHRTRHASGLSGRCHHRHPERGWVTSIFMCENTYSRHHWPQFAW